VLSGLAPRCLQVEPHPGPALALPPQGKYSVKDPRVALALCSPEVSASTAALLEGVFQTLGFESCRRQEASIQVSPHLPPLPQPLPSAPPGASLHSGWHSLLPQGFRGELTRFREQLDAHGGSVGCAFVALVARPWQLRQSQQLVRELSRCKALWGRPKVFLLLSALPGVSGPAEPPGGGPNRVGVGWAGGPRPSLQARVLLLLHPAVPEPGAFLASLGELCGRRPHWSLLQLLTEVFSRTAEESAGAAYCPVLRSSLRGALCLGNVEPWGPETFQEEMAQFRKRLDAHRGPVSCALVALMAHGGPQGQLLGADGQERQLEVLVQELSHCGALRGRPKIFLLQACRGGHRDAGVGPAALPWFRCWLRAPPATPFQADVLHVCTDVQGRSSRGPTPGSPNQADVLMVYAAAEGCVAYRDEKGSDFIQTLVEVLRADPKADLLELMTEVNRQVCELDVLGPDCDDRRKACLEIRSSLRRRLCLQV
uniref:Caspase-14-like n=1 Tax=Bos mutus grunniens TaxID=30521 RepID=A0A8B9YL08_BOSMU